MLKLNLSQKALLLVVVPLTCQLAFLYGISLLLDQSERDVRIQAHARELMLGLNDVLKLVLNEAAGVTAYGVSRDSYFLKRYANASDAVPERMAALKEITKDNPEELQAIINLENSMNAGALNFRKIREKVHGKDYFGAVKVMNETKPLLADLYEQFDVANSLGEDLKNAAPMTEERARRALRRLLWLSAFASVLVAVGVTIAINRSTTSRLQRLVENTNRFANGKPLLPVVQGHDEIAHLDAVFHDMTKTVEEAQALKRQFVSVISHELRTPLMNVQGILELLEAGAYGSLNENGAEQVASAVVSTDRVMNLINDLLSIDKLESGMLEINPRECDLVAVVSRAVQITGNLAEKKKIEIQQQHVAPEIPIFIDPDRITQVITNLISNAIKYSDANTTVTIRTEYIDTYTLRLTVEDQGRGIPAESISKVFDRYVQVRQSDAHVGTGLGLAICKAIVEQHNGRIFVTSEPGKGSQFFFDLPCSSSGPLKEVVTTGHDSVTSSA